MTPKTIAQFALGPLGGAILGVIVVPVIAWFFSQEDIGRAAMLQVTLSFSTLLFSLGLDQSYVRDFHEDENKPALLKTALLPGLVLLVLVLAIFFLLDDLLAKLLFDLPSQNLSVLVMASVLAMFLSRFLSLVLRMKERALAFSLGKILPNFILLLLLSGYFALGLPRNFYWLVLANALATISVFLLHAWNTRNEWTSAISAVFDVQRLQEMLRFGLPLILSGLAFWGLTATDKVLLRALSSYEELGLYSVTVSLASAALILQNIFSTVWAPTVYKWAAQDESLEKIQQVSRYVLLCVIVLFSLAGLFSWILDWLLPVGYAKVKWLVVACLGYPLLYTLSETTVVGIGITRRSVFAMIAALVAFSFNLLANWLLIPSYGAAGAATSSCAAFLIFLVLRTEFSSLLWRYIPRLSTYMYALLLVSGAVASAMWGELLGSLLAAYWFLTLLSCIVTFADELLTIRKLAIAHLQKL